MCKTGKFIYFLSFSGARKSLIPEDEFAFFSFFKKIDIR